MKRKCHHLLIRRPHSWTQYVPKFEKSVNKISPKSVKRWTCLSLFMYRCSDDTMESSTEAFRFLTNLRKVRLTTLEYLVVRTEAQPLPKKNFASQRKAQLSYWRKNKNMLQDWDCKICTHLQSWQFICAYFRVDFDLKIIWLLSLLQKKSPFKFLLNK